MKRNDKQRSNTSATNKYIEQTHLSLYNQDVEEEEEAIISIKFFRLTTYLLLLKSLPNVSCCVVERPLPSPDTIG